MRADRGEEDSGDIRVYERPASGERVCCTPCWGGEDAAVGLHDSEERIVAIKFELRDVGRWAAVNDEFVQHFELLGFDVLEVFRCGGAVGVLGAVNGAGEAHAEVDAHPGFAHDLVE